MPLNTGCPVREVAAEDGRVRLTFVAPDVETLGDVAAALDVGTSTVAQHLAAAQSTLLDALLDE